MTRKCWKCKKYLDISEFHNDKNRRLGKSYMCTICSSKNYKLWSKNNPDGERIKSRNYRRKTYFKNKKKNSARWALNYQIRAGNIYKQPCKVCGDLKSQAHHPDYSKPLEVIWVCKKHHCNIHFASLKI